MRIGCYFDRVVCMLLLVSIDLFAAGQQLRCEDKDVLLLLVAAHNLSGGGDT